MHIGIFGDSFADYNNMFALTEENESWINYLSKYTGATFECFGYGGTSIWYSFEKFKEHYKKFTHIVFCQTFPHRIHHLPEELIGFHHVKDTASLSFMNSKAKNTMNFITSIYYSKLFNKDLDIFLAQQVFDQVNYLCKKENIQIVTMLPFEDLRYQEEYIINVDNRQGDCLLGLQHVSVDEILITQKPNGLTSGDARFCHLSKENNEILAGIIKESFESDKKQVFNFSVESSDDYKKFIIDKKISDRYFK
jgi:hypothetical protein